MLPNAAKKEPLEGHPRYQKVKALSSGSFGFVELAWDRVKGEQVAIKFIERGEKISRYVENEILNHRSLMHPHIIEFKEVFLTQEHLGIAMEYAEAGNLQMLVGVHGALSENVARWYFQQLIVAVDYAHRMGVANRDIKLENTLLNGNPPLLKICDFGYSKREKFQSAPGSRVGTPAYLAPEVVSNIEAGQKYNGKIADIWSCGVMLFVMLTGTYPFTRPEDAHQNAFKQLEILIQRILHVEYSFPPHLTLTEDCKDMVRRMLVPDPAQRITIAQILQHPWFARDLPPGVAEMNNSRVDERPGLQDVEEIRKILEEAKTVPSATGMLQASGTVWEPDDEDIDDELNDDYDWPTGSRPAAAANQGWARQPAPARAPLAPGSRWDTQSPAHKG